MIQPWFNEAKFGVMVTWGIHSAGDTSESWAFFNNEISHSDYMKQADTFTAAKYDPDAWAKMFADAGIRYATLVTKHHDGFALWDTAYSKVNAKDGSPAGRDLVGPFCEALRKHNLKVGIYFSHLDWTHPDYASVRKISQTPEHATKSYPFSYPEGPDDPVAWNRFLKFHRAQLSELCNRYHPDLLWFDGDWERDPEQWNFKVLRHEILEWLPNVILNSRIGAYGDFCTPEQSMPIARPSGPFEYCMTLNDTWGFRKTDHNFKTARQCIRILADCASMGGNLMLGIGPHSDGTFPAEVPRILGEIGEWLNVYGEAIYGTQAGLPFGHFHGLSTLNNADNVLYLICFDQPHDEIPIKGMYNTIRRVSVVGGGEVHHRTMGGAPWCGLPGIAWIEAPAKPGPLATTVFKIELDGPLRLYEGAGRHIEINQ